MLWTKHDTIFYAWIFVTRCQTIVGVKRCLVPWKRREFQFPQFSSRIQIISEILVNISKRKLLTHFFHIIRSEKMSTWQAALLGFFVVAFKNWLGIKTLLKMFLFAASWYIEKTSFSAEKLSRSDDARLLLHRAVSGTNWVLPGTGQGICVEFSARLATGSGTMYGKWLIFFFRVGL